MSYRKLTKGTQNYSYLENYPVFVTYFDSSERNYITILNNYCNSNYNKYVGYKLRLVNEKISINLLFNLRKSLFIKMLSILFSILLWVLFINFEILLRNFRSLSINILYYKCKC